HTQIITLSLHDALPIFNSKGFIRDEEDNDVARGTGAVFHGFALGEPDEIAGTEHAFVRDELAFEDVHAVATGVGVQRIDHSGGQIGRHTSELQSLAYLV